MERAMSYLRQAMEAMAIKAVNKGRFDMLRIMKVHKKNKKRRWTNNGRRKHGRL